MRQGGECYSVEMERAANIAQTGNLFIIMEKTFEGQLRNERPISQGGQKLIIDCEFIPAALRILIFDDSTSTLDAKSRRLVQNE